MNKKAVLYARVSHEQYRFDQFALEKQIQQLTQYCEREEVQILRVYSEVASGSSMLRTEFLRMMRFCEENNGEIDNLLFVETGVLSMNPAHTIDAISTLIQLKVEPLAISEPVTFNKWFEIFKGLVQVNNENTKG